jgi:hypothetical protein
MIVIKYRKTKKLFGLFFETNEITLPQLSRFILLSGTALLKDTIPECLVNREEREERVEQEERHEHEYGTVSDLRW